MPASHSVQRMRSGRPFIVCIHDATPAWARETRMMIRDLAPLVGRRLSFGVVPDWHGKWPLVAHPEYCRLVRESSEELLLHGCYHRRRRGWGIISSLTNGSDEMNGLDPDETRRTLQRGQRVFAEVFGKPARGFLAPGWQPGHVRRIIRNTAAMENGRQPVGNTPGLENGLERVRNTAGMENGLDQVLGYFSLESSSGRSVPLATWTWDCGRWGWLGYVGHWTGSLLHSVNRGVPVLAIHPLDVERGFWPQILRLTGELLEAGYEPSTLTGLLEASDVEVGI